MKVKHCDPMSMQEEVEGLHKKIKELEEQRDKAVFQAQEWGFKYKEAQEELDRVKPLYKKFYKNPLFWFVRPMDEEYEGRVLMRCVGPYGQNTCGKLFWVKDDNTPGIHTKHLHTRAAETSVWEYIKARYLPFLIRTKQPGAFFDN